MLKLVLGIIIVLISMLSTESNASGRIDERLPTEIREGSEDSGSIGLIDHPSQENSLPKNFEAKQNYPNPFNATTTIEYNISQECGIYTVIYNVLGLKVRTLENVLRVPGKYKIEWDGRNDDGDTVASGVYFYVLVADDNYAIRKMLLIK